MADPRTLTIAVLTYRRNDDLREILPLLLGQLGELRAGLAGEVVVVDNDAAGPGEPVVAAVGDPRLRYVVEPTPGIAAARNRALDECAARDLLVFIDDDERPMEHWLATLLATRDETGAAAVAGPVRSEYLGVLDPWIDAGGFFGRRHRIGVPSGTPIPVAATNNLLLDLRVVRDCGVRFAVDVAMAGGEDNLFTRSLTRAGGRIVWCADAWVSELVPAGRATRRWVLTRQMSSGNALARVQLRMSEGRLRAARTRAVLLTGGVARIAGGAARWVAGTTTRSLTHRARGARTVSRGVGMLLGALGYSHQAYRRTPPAGPR